MEKHELEEIRYFKIEELEDLDNEGFEWLKALKKLYENCNIMLQNLENGANKKWKLLNMIMP